MEHPAPDHDVLRKKLIAARLALTDRLERAVALQSVLRVWLVGRSETSIGAYWPIKGEFDPLPALYRWTEGAPDGVVRRIGLPVADRASGQLRFHVWYPGCPTELDAYDIPKPKDTEEFAPASDGGRELHARLLAAAAAPRARLASRRDAHGRRCDVAAAIGLMC
jgi:5-formyltetrahydrofolate cyclo-ligase